MTHDGPLPDRLEGAGAAEALERLMLARIRPDTRMQCRVCWFLYDPAEGLPDWGIEPGTPFGELPADWTCPGCGQPKAAFLPADEGR